MGACCTCQTGLRYREAPTDDHHAKPKNIKSEDSNQVIAIDDYGARISLQGSTKFISMFTRQGRKGVNQDAITVWEVRICKTLDFLKIYNNVRFCSRNL